MNISHISNDIKEQIAKFEPHFEQYTNAEAAAADQIVAEHHQNVLQFREAEKSLKDKEATLRKAKETEEYSTQCSHTQLTRWLRSLTRLCVVHDLSFTAELRDAMIRHAGVREEMATLTAKLAALPATLAAAQTQQTTKNDALQQKQMGMCVGFALLSIRRRVSMYLCFDVFAWLLSCVCLLRYRHRQTAHNVWR